MSPRSFHIHGESARWGVRLACHMFQGKAPPDDAVTRILNTRPEHIQVAEFALEALSTVHRERQERRRTYAVRAMEVLLHRITDSTLLTAADLEKIAAQSWRLAAMMEREEEVSASLDSLAEPKKG